MDNEPELTPAEAAILLNMQIEERIVAAVSQELQTGGTLRYMLELFVLDTMKGSLAGNLWQEKLADADYMSQRRIEEALNNRSG